MQRGFRYATIIGAALATLLVAVTEPRAAELKVIYSNSNLVKQTHDEFKQHFEASHKGDTVNLAPTLEYTDALAVALRQALIGTSDDLGYYGLSDICLLAERGIAKPLDGLMARDPEWAGLGIPADVLDIAKCNGVTYGMPFGASYMVVIFNKTLVAQAGGDPDHLPKTWPDILDLARKIKAKNGGIYFNYSGSSSWSFMTMVQSLGGKILSPDGTDIAFDSREGLRALQIVADIGAAAGHLDMSKAQARQAFEAGTMGILVDSSSGLADYKKAAAGRFDLAVSLFPIENNGRLPASGMLGVLQATSADKQSLAWDYLKYSVGPDGETLLGKETGFLPFNSIAIESPDKLGTYYASNPELQVSAQSVKIATAWPSFPGPNGLKIHQLVIDYLQRVYTGVMQPEAALAQLTAETRRLLK